MTQEQYLCFLGTGNHGCLEHREMLELEKLEHIIQTTAKTRITSDTTNIQRKIDNASSSPSHQKFDYRKKQSEGQSELDDFEKFYYEECPSATNSNEERSDQEIDVGNQLGDIKMTGHEDERSDGMYLENQFHECQ